MTLYTVLKGLLTGLFKVVYNLKIHGSDKVPENGKYVVVSNHISLGDVIILAISCKRQIHFMAKKELFSIPLLAGLIKALGAFPVDRNGSAVSALKTAVKHLESEKLVGMFPQGTRRRGQSVDDTEFKPGAAFCAYKSKAGFIPCYIKTKDQCFGFFKRTDIYFGDPIEYSTLPYTEGGSEEYARVTEIIKSEIFRLESDTYGGKFNA